VVFEGDHDWTFWLTQLPDHIKWHAAQLIPKSRPEQKEKKH